MTSNHVDIVSRLLPARGRVFVISGPSGVGKGTVLNGMLRSSSAPARLTRCTTATTRAPREGEVDGVNYHFFSHEEFERRAAQGYFLEHARYNDNFYGTPRENVKREQAAGNDVLLEIEVQGGLSIRALDLDAVLVFLAPPSWDELERRLRNRATDDAGAVERRLAIARREMDAAPNYDYLIVNDDLDRAVATLQSVIVAERQRIRL
jgi:guanylate kinase